MAKVTVEGCLCERCSHIWIPQRRMVDEPKICPKCKSPYWNKPRRVTKPSATRTE